MTTAIKPNFEVIAKIAPAFEGWCAWKYHKGIGIKPKKPPYGLSKLIRTTAPDDWLTFNQARELFNGGRYEGVGVLCSAAHGIVGFDIDDCLDEHGGLLGWAAEHVAALSDMGTYVEVSPSGSGLRAFVRGVMPQGIKEKVNGIGGSLEVYGPKSERYLTLTGKVWPAGGFREIKENQVGIDDYLNRFGFMKTAEPDEGAEAGAGKKVTSTLVVQSHSDDEIVALLKKRNKQGRITRLMAGDTADAGGDSEARASAINEVAYYTKDKAQIRRILESAFAALRREKWSEKRGNEDFIDYDIGRLVKKCKGDYWEDVEAAAEERKADKEKADKLAKSASEFLIGGLAGIPTVKGGRIASSFHAAHELLIRDMRVAGAIAHNAFSCETVKLRTMADTFGGKSKATGPLIDSDAVSIRLWLEREWCVRLRQDDVNAAIELAARVAWFNPVTDKLSSLVWDGVERLPSMLVDYLCAGASNNPPNGRYLAEIGLRWMIATVARAFEPGCKHDSMLVLEGAQGVGKSRALRTLCDSVCPAAFTENVPMLSAGGQEAERALAGVWIAEMSELSFMKRADAEHVKQFLSRTGDRVRAPYGVRYSLQPRTVSFAGSTNEGEYIADVTGGRRFWSFKVFRRIDIGKLERDAPQLWAEAVARYRRGEHWYLKDAEIVLLADREQRQRMTTSSWDDAIFNVLIPKLVADAKGKGEADYWGLQQVRFRPVELYAKIMGKQFEGEVIPQADGTVFGLALSRCGFEKIKSGVVHWSIGDRLVRELIEAARNPPKEAA